MIEVNLNRTQGDISLRKQSSQSNYSDQQFETQRVLRPTMKLNSTDTLQNGDKVEKLSLYAKGWQRINQIRNQDQKEMRLSLIDR